MKILNVIDTKFNKALLKKFYTNNNINYNFVESNEDIFEKIHEFKPDIIFIQDVYSYISGSTIIQWIKECTDVRGFYSKIIYWTSQDTKVATQLLQNEIKDMNDIMVISGADLVKTIGQVISDITRSLSEEQETIEDQKAANKILLVDDDPFMHSVIKGLLKDRNYEIISAYNGQEAYEVYNHFLPSLIITDIEMPCMNGLELCKKIKEHNVGRVIPIIILSSNSNPLDIDTAFNYGADDYLTKPIDSNELHSKIEEYFSSFERNKKDKILVVDDNKLITEIIRHGFLKKGINVLTAKDGWEAYQIVIREHPEVVITDVEMPTMTGYELCEKIMNTPQLQGTYLLMMSGKDKPCDIKKGQKHGVTRYFVKPFDVDKLILTVEQLLLEKYQLYKKEYEFMLASIKSLIFALEARDEYTSGHTDRVCRMSVELARYLDLDSRVINDIEIGANLHDIGKIGIRDAVLLKDGKLTDAEYSMIQEHTIIGAEILRPIKSLENVIPLIMFHHERWDGRGYPTMIRREEIPIGARIIAVADTFDAITSDRPYRKAMTAAQALEIIEQNIGTQFCPTCAKGFIKMMGCR